MSRQIATRFLGRHDGNGLCELPALPLHGFLRGFVAVITPVMHDQPMLLATVEPAGIDQSRHEPARIIRWPTDGVGNLVIAPTPDVAANRMSRSEVPKAFEQPDRREVRRAQQLRQSLRFRMVDAGSFHWPSPFWSWDGFGSSFGRAWSRDLATRSSLRSNRASLVRLANRSRTISVGGMASSFVSSGISGFRQVVE